MLSKQTIIILFVAILAIGGLVYWYKNGKTMAVTSVAAPIGGGGDLDVRNAKWAREMANVPSAPALSRNLMPGTLNPFGRVAAESDALLNFPVFTSKSIDPLKGVAPPSFDDAEPILFQADQSQFNDEYLRLNTFKEFKAMQ